MDAMNSSSPGLCEKCGHPSFRQSHLLPDLVQTNQVRLLLRSTAMPPETSWFRSVISDAPEELARYDAEIERLQKILDKLAAERARLESYGDQCRAIFAPVRRLPTEMLVEIFDMCAPPNTELLLEDDTPSGELGRLAKQHLFHLSQVCARWHDVAMGTPRLWSTIVAAVPLWHGTAAGRLLDRLQYSLAQGGAHPLSVHVAVDRDANEIPVLSSLEKYAHRWRELYLWISLESFQFLTGAKGNLPLLEVLYIAVQGDRAFDVDIFEVAQRLQFVTFTGKASRIPKFPWAQIEEFRYRYVLDEPADLFNALNLMANMSPDTVFSFNMNLSHIELPVGLPTIVSNVTYLTVLLIVSPDRNQATEVLGEIFQALTLPQLKQLDFQRDWNDPPPFWHQAQFLAFAARSALHGTLIELEIHVPIADEELLDCLEVLPLLTDLIISDYGGERILITDNLLRRLTRKADDTAPLVPALQFFCMTALFRFTDDVYWDFLISRLPPEKTDEPFQARVWWLSGHEREFGPEMCERIAGLVEGGVLGFETGQDPSEPVVI